jgi:methionyl aminopeptidase
MNNPTPKTELIPLHNSEGLDRQRIAGIITAKCLKKSFDLISSKTPNLSLKDIELECEKIISENNAIATFKNYNGFPGSICASVNKEIVHGIASDYILQEGDIVKIDVGVTFEHAIGDAALTVIYGAPKKPQHRELVLACKKSLDLAIAAISVGKQLGIIGETIYRHARDTRFKVITEYGGHGIDDDTLHAKPFVDNKSHSNLGVRIQPGMTFTIEPMFTIGDDKVKLDKNKWTLLTKDMSAHFEHTLFIHEDHTEIITDWENI